MGEGKKELHVLYYSNPTLFYSVTPGNLAIKFGQLIKYSVRNIFL